MRRVAVFLALSASSVLATFQQTLVDDDQPPVANGSISCGWELAFTTDGPEPYCTETPDPDGEAWTLYGHCADMLRMNEDARCNITRCNEIFQDSTGGIRYNKWSQSVMESIGKDCVLPAGPGVQGAYYEWSSASSRYRQYDLSTQFHWNFRGCPVWSNITDVFLQDRTDGSWTMEDCEYALTFRYYYSNGEPEDTDNYSGPAYYWGKLEDINKHSMPMVPEHHLSDFQYNSSNLLHLIDVVVPDEYADKCKLAPFYTRDADALEDVDAHLIGKVSYPYTSTRPMMVALYAYNTQRWHSWEQAPPLASYCIPKA